MKMRRSKLEKKNENKGYRMYQTIWNANAREKIGDTYGGNEYTPVPLGDTGKRQRRI